MLPGNNNTKPRLFDPATRMLHWLTVALITLVFVFAFSVDLVANSWQINVLQLHRSFGVSVLVATAGRLVWRQFTKFPDWPTTMSKPMQLFAQVSEYALYALILAQPILGLLQTNARGDRVDFFFLGRLPALIDQNRPLSKQLLSVHETVGFLLLGLIALHVSATLYRHFWQRDGTLRAMLPPANWRRDSISRNSIQ